MNRENLIKKINNIVYLANTPSDDMYVGHNDGHPAFYVKHTNQEYVKELNRVIPLKDNYDEYDLYYYVSYMFKYMLHPYDSHTRMFFINNKFLPIKIRMFNGIPYIVDASDSLSKYKGRKILKINDMDINEVICKLDDITCYSSSAYFNIELEKYLTNPDVISSIPNMKKNSTMVFTTDSGNITFDLNHLDKFVDTMIKPNYNLEIRDNTVIITYNSCRDKELMISLVNKLKTLKGIDNYIVDLRGNHGGNSSVSQPLLDYLNGKNVIVLSDERVFSAARMCLANFKKNGAKIIGKRPGTSINCFGNCCVHKLDDMNLGFKISTVYVYYTDDLVKYGVRKNSFDTLFCEHPDLLEPKFLDVDEEIELTLEDYINHTDSVMDYALNYLNNKRKDNKRL